ncbi:MAG: hypothetical protein A2W76_08225 [Gammaproteobacteria bacterium RIFCSPLOWO2_12_47_11]|jgi:cytochrome c-type biogenesis protein CcmH/NrfG|nr:MAG: hypothetical protein A2W76_08225 [Gammaproteobacteria bacterium RIFCSPLOWO2_12_47_11]
MDNKEHVDLLKEIRDNQKLQLERQAEALAIQKEQFEIFRKQMEQTQRIQDRAEMLQDKSAQIIGSARKVFIVVVPVLVLLIIYVSWLLFR